MTKDEAIKELVAAMKGAERRGNYYEATAYDCAIDIVTQINQTMRDNGND